MSEFIIVLEIALSAKVIALNYFVTQKFMVGVA